MSSPPSTDRPAGGSAPAPAPGGHLSAYLLALRPLQWSKNVLVFAALAHTFVIGMETMEDGQVPVAGATSAISTCTTGSRARTPAANQAAVKPARTKRAAEPAPGLYPR